MNLNFKVFGEGKDLIILHGLFGSLDNWQSLAKRFSETHRVWIVDQRNHGKSFHDPKHSYSLMAKDLKAFMEIHEIPSATLIGHSMGGKTALQFAKQYPEVLDGLIIVDMVMEQMKAGHQGIFDAMFALRLEDIERRIEADTAMQASIPNFAVRQFLLKNLQRKEGGGFQWKMNLLGLYKEYENVLAGVVFEGEMDLPLLVIAGGKSDYIGKENRLAYEAHFSNLEFEIIEEAGHWVHAEKADDFFGVVNGFLNKH